MAIPSLAKTVDVSVVIPCFRCTATIQRAIASVAQQTLMPAEVILVDDCSADGTLAALISIEQAYSGWVKVLPTGANRGAASARNLGWEAATQRYIAFLDADDAWHQKKIELQYGYMESHPELTLSGHSHRMLGSDSGSFDWEVGEFTPLVISKKMMLLSNRFITPSVMLKRDIPLRFAEGKRHMEDHLLWMEIVCSNMQTVRFNAELAAIYKPIYGSAGLSSQLWPMELGDLQNYRHLYRQGEISLATWFAISLYSLAKFVRRVFVTWGYARWR